MAAIILSVEGLALSDAPDARGTALSRHLGDGCRPFLAAFIAFFVAQFLKVFTFWYSEQRWDYTRLAGSGGMPSSHTACVSPGLLCRLISLELMAAIISCT